ncbi:FG-GAP-like repeat-containing protein [Mangrovibacterium sp.]|uniref:FG-GAP-like repeat-containing protein n=1 Tax=Mangrovibacterium sp. TaxID=1961364 RepID=UPI0035655BA9
MKLKLKHIIPILLVSLGIQTSWGQDFDISVSGTESGTKWHYARNSITFENNYSYTPSGGTMTADIMNPVVTGDISYNYTIVDPETRSLNTSYQVGTTNGSFDISPVGGATYSIPIDVAPGIGGLQPTLTITYNSMEGPGIAGYGWNIFGISAITRSPQTYYSDGTSGGINLDSNDRFSLDGLRLKCTSGTYGSNASQYRTETDIFTRVTCYTGSYGPTQFFAETKNGLKCQYGYDSDADQTITGVNEVVNWYMNKVTDVYGNEMDYAYIKDNGSIYLGEITYGPNTVTFYYKSRSDKTSYYLKGNKIDENLILDKIEVKYNSNVVKKYEFKYNYTSSNYTRYSVLNEVVEYGIGSTRMNSTAFTYQTPDNVSFTQTVYNTTHSYVTYKSKLVTGDFNGDGKADFLCLPDASKGATWTGYKIYYGDGSDNFYLLFSNTSYSFGTLDDIYAIDLNADGKDDVVFESVSGSTSTFKYCINSGSALGTAYTLCSLSNNSETGYSGKKRRKSDKQENDNEISGADLTGDGINDLFINDGSGNWKVYSMGSSSGVLGSMTLRASGTISTLNKQVLTGDFNGDGNPDIWSFDDSGVKIYSFNGSSLTQLYTSTWPTRNHFFNLGDFNGDGKVDIFLYGYKNGSTEYDWSDWQIQLSTGTGFSKNSIPRKKTNLKNDYVRLGDFNGDGATDVMVSSSNESWTGTYFYISKNEGSDFYTNSLPSYPSSTHSYYVSDYDGDGRSDFMCTDGLSPWWNGYQMYRSGSKNRILLEKISDGLNRLTKITYKTLSQYGAPYTKGTGATFPVCDFQGALPVVSSIQTGNGLGSLNTINYTYEGAKIHRQGKGFLCYSKMTATDVASNMKTESNYDYHTSYFYPRLLSAVNKYSSTTLSTTNNSWSYKTTVSGIIWPYISSSTQNSSLTGHSVTQTANYDTYGNLTSSVKTFDNGASESTNIQYTNDATNWLLGKADTKTVTYSKGGESSVSNTVSYTYNTDGILKPDFITYYQGTSLEYYQNHDYDSKGNLSQVYVYGGSIGASQTNYTYETNGVRVKTTTDPLGHTTTNNYDSYGRINSQVDYLNNTTSFTYDNFGRIATETTPDGFVKTTAYNWGLTGGPTNASYYVQQSGNDGSITKTWYDQLVREIRSEGLGFSGSYIYTVTEYNTKGQLYRVSEPSTSSSPSLWNTNSYNSYGQLTGVTRASGQNSTFAYTFGNSRVTETTGGKTSWKETDSQGLVTQAHDSGGDIIYAYYPDGKVKTITAPGNAVTSMEYNDAARNQTKLIDPSAGTIEYTYNSLGQLKTQKNGRSQTTTFNYHADGRINTKVSPEGTTTYGYNGNKQLTSISSPGSVSRSYGYDTKGRVSSISEAIPGSTALATGFTYDSKGRLETRTHPSGIVETNHYNSYGYLDYISAGGATRYTITAMNERQQVTAATFGSSLYGTYGYDSYGYPTYSKAQNSGSYRQDYRYSFNPVTGNLNSRENYLKSKSESFTYDNLDRLQTVTGPQNLTMDYDANGNITTKSDVGSIFVYEHPTIPYALTGIESSTGLIADDTQTATYTSFEQVSTIDESDYYATFTYNSDQQRAKMEVVQVASTILTRWYAGNSYMKETEGSTTKEYTWIGGDAYSAPVVAIKESGTTNYFYLLRDYLGNITHVVNTSNTVTAEYSYDAWGRRRDKDDWGYTLSGEPDLLAGRSFTSHEYLPWFKLVNMNGRLYDPVVGRFLSADPYVQMPDGTQSFNRYSYCINNPLRYTDLSGYTWKIFKPFVKAVKWLANAAVNAAAVVIGFPVAVTITAITTAVGLGQGIFTGDWTILRNEAKIIGGLYTGSLKQIVSRFTWELPQTIVGYIASQGSNMIGDVEDVSYFHGATVVRHYSDKWGGFTIGSYINIDSGSTNYDIMHEYGHYLQSQAVGPGYLFGYALPSLINAGAMDSQDRHNAYWVEQDANVRARNYFGDSNWSYWTYPILGSEYNQSYTNRYGKYQYQMGPKWWQKLYENLISKK